MDRRPWYRWHATTWAALLVLGAALATCQFASLSPYGENRGWPLIAAAWNGAILRARAGFNLIVGLLLLAATAVVAERIRRGAREHGQLPLRTAFGVTAAAAFVLFLVRLQAVQRLFASLDAFVLLLNLIACLAVVSATLFTCERLLDRRLQPWQRRVAPVVPAVVAAASAIGAMWFVNELLAYNRFDVPRWNASLDWQHWYLAGPILLGVACAIYTTGWLAAGMLARLARLVRGARESGDGPGE